MKGVIGNPQAAVPAVPAGVDSGFHRHLQGGSCCRAVLEGQIYCVAGTYLHEGCSREAGRSKARGPFAPGGHFRREGKVGSSWARMIQEEVGEVPATLRRAATVVLEALGAQKEWPAAWTCHLVRQLPLLL